MSEITFSGDAPARSAGRMHAASLFGGAKTPDVFDGFPLSKSLLIPLSKSLLIMCV
jgi:hypothetical protein